MALNRPAVAARSALKVAVLNAAGGADFDAILACLSVRRWPTRAPCCCARRAGGCRGIGMVEFAPALAAALKMSFAFLPSFGRVEGGGEFRAIGNAILCAQPLEHFRAVPLPKPPYKFRQRHLLWAFTRACSRASTSTAAASRLGVAHLERLWDPAGAQLADGMLS